MALRERLIKETGAPGPAGFDVTGQQSFQEMKARLHRTLINRMDLTKLSALTQEQVHDEVARLAEAVLAQEGAPLSAAERERLVNDVQHELFGLGPLETLLADPITPTFWLMRTTRSTSSDEVSSNRLTWPLKMTSI